MKTLFILSSVIALISIFLVIYLSWIRTPFAILPMAYLYGHIVIVAVTYITDSKNKEGDKIGN